MKIKREQRCIKIEKQMKKHELGLQKNMNLVYIVICHRQGYIVKL